MYGGEGGIRTPDSLATMSDFESGAFNRALPPLRCVTPLLVTLSLSFLFEKLISSWLAGHRERDT